MKRSSYGAIHLIQRTTKAHSTRKIHLLNATQNSIQQYMQLFAMGDPNAEIIETNASVKILSISATILVTI